MREFMNDTENGRDDPDRFDTKTILLAVLNRIAGRRHPGAISAKNTNFLITIKDLGGLPLDKNEAHMLPT